MHITQLYVYPIKSLRGAPTASATITKYGFQYDRRFMLLKVQRDGSHENMHVAGFPEMTLFHTAITPPSDADGTGSIEVTFSPPGEHPAALRVPLQPATAGLEQLSITMHQSPTTGYRMDPASNAWFSRCFGYDVVLAYLGDNTRAVLMSRSPNAQAGSSWLSAMASAIPSLASAERDEITFADCAQFLVVSETSVENVSARLPDAMEMDVTKFRPNIVVGGVDAAWDEDFWADIAVGGANITLTHNCIRCKSLNIDYSTGKPGKGPVGEVLKRLQKDRRVDAGAKYSPVFGRYGFVDKTEVGKQVAVGGQVRVLKRNGERTKIDWPGIGN